MYQMEVQGAERATYVAQRLIRGNIDFNYKSLWLGAGRHGGQFEVAEDEGGKLQQIVTAAWDAFPG